MNVALGKKLKVAVVPAANVWLEEVPGSGMAGASGHQRQGSGTEAIVIDGRRSLPRLLVAWYFEAPSSPAEEAAMDSDRVLRRSAICPSSCAVPSPPAGRTHQKGRPPQYAVIAVQSWWDKERRLTFGTRMDAWDCYQD
jgi:hypothetical protein